MKLNLKLNTSSNSAPNGQPSAASPPPAQGAKLKLNFGGSTPSKSSPPAVSFPDSQTKPKKQVGKKRPREDDDQAPLAPPKKRASGGSGILNLSSVLNKAPGAAHPITPKTPGSAAVPFFKINNPKKAKPPTRPLGVGYDSDAEDAEDDPAIEENVVLRMEPGPDCDYLREAIAQNLIGKPINQGGADVMMRFYKNRRAAIVIRGTVYAAVLADLPCIVESMKSWDKRGWWKSADICQMLLVVGKVAGEKDAEGVSMPREVDQKTSQYPHGLTPPMHHVRKRRFRKRVSHTTIEQAEDRVEELMENDRTVSESGGKIEVETVDLDTAQSQEASEEEEEDAEGEPEYDEQQMEYQNGYGEYEEGGGEEEEEDPEAIARRFEQELMGGDPSALEVTEQDAATTGVDGAQLAAAQATGDQAEAPVEEADAESDEDDDDDDDDADEGNEEDQEQVRLKAQQREEIQDLERDIEKATNDLSQASNPIIRQRFEKRLTSLRDELASKKRSLGEDPDDE